MQTGNEGGILTKEIISIMNKAINEILNGMEDYPFPIGEKDDAEIIIDNEVVKTFDNILSSNKYTEERTSITRYNTFEKLEEQITEVKHNTPRGFIICTIETSSKEINNGCATKTKCSIIVNHAKLLEYTGIIHPRWAQVIIRTLGKEVIHAESNGDCYFYDTEEMDEKINLDALDAYLQMTKILDKHSPLD
jgi:hypothetical protein